MFVLVDQDLYKTTEVMMEPKRRACLPGRFAVFIIECEKSDFDKLTENNKYNDVLVEVPHLDIDILEYVK